MSLTARQLELLREMVETDEELVCEGIAIWLGDRRVSAMIPHAFLKIAVISDVSDTKGLVRYVANETAKAVVARPALADEIDGAITVGKPFTIIDNRVALL
jgi:hypothetical protein